MPRLPAATLPRPAPLSFPLAPAAPTNPTVGGQGHWQVPGEPGQHLVLLPGQMHVGTHVASLRTLLGSCVAITLWHPTRRIGGMCHFLLPWRNRRVGEPLDGRFGDEAVEAMVKTLTLLQARPEDCVVHLYGGADTLAGVSGTKIDIGARNVEQGRSLIARYGFQMARVDVGDDVPRTVTLSLADGQVHMRRGSGPAPDHLPD